MQNFVKRSKANKPYTILLVGGPGVGKTSFVRFIASAVLGTCIERYDVNIYGRGPGERPHLYEIMRQHDIWVSANAFKGGEEA